MSKDRYCVKSTLTRVYFVLLKVQFQVKFLEVELRVGTEPALSESTKFPFVMTRPLLLPSHYSEEKSPLPSFSEAEYTIRMVSFHQAKGGKVNDIWVQF